MSEEALIKIFKMHLISCSKFLQNCVKIAQIQSFSGPYFPIFSPNTGKYGPEKPRIWTLFAQCRSKKVQCLDLRFVVFFIRSSLRFILTMLKHHTATKLFSSSLLLLEEYCFSYSDVVNVVGVGDLGRLSCCCWKSC